MGPRRGMDMQAYKHKLTHSERMGKQEQKTKESQFQKPLQSVEKGKKVFRFNRSYVIAVVNTFFAIDEEDLKEAELYKKEHGVIMVVSLLVSAIMIIGLYTYLNNILF